MAQAPGKSGFRASAKRALSYMASICDDWVMRFTPSDRATAARRKLIEPSDQQCRIDRTQVFLRTVSTVSTWCPALYPDGPDDTAGPHC
jgi:hypothetical protein